MAHPGQTMSRRKAERWQARVCVPAAASMPSCTTGHSSGTRRTVLAQEQGWHAGQG